MCRLFCSFSVHETSPYSSIFESKYSILRQADAEGHRDGWGIFAYSGKHLALQAREAMPLSETADEAKAIVKGINSKCSGFFVRQASNPLNLAREEIWTIDATQPFIYGNMAFMHNGAVNEPRKVLGELGEPCVLPGSNNDSEVYSIIFIKYFKELGDAYKAFAATEKFIVKAYEKVKDESNTDKFAYTSLNAIFTDGSHVYAFNKYYSNRIKSISDPSRDFYKMCYKEENDAMLIASEPTDESEWHDLGNGVLLDAWIEDNKIKHSLKSI
ncbi:MAG: class II glutamine amidotransferase [Candidatus Micrarchaeia archaeon]